VSMHVLDNSSPTTQEPNSGPMNCESCSWNPFLVLFRCQKDRGQKQEQKKQSQGNRIEPSRQNSTCTFWPRSDKEVDAVVKKWAECAHPRARELFKTTTKLEEILTQFAKFTNKTDDLLSGSSERCIHWYGYINEDHRPALKITVPGETAVRAWDVNYLLVFIFAPDELFEPIHEFPTQLSKMGCDDQLCVHLAHVAISI